MAGFTTRPEIRGTFGVVASTHWLASAVGMSILEKGGNAFDAAAAAGFTLQVVEPSTNGPLGEAPMLVWSEANRRCDMICGQGVAPASCDDRQVPRARARSDPRHRAARRCGAGRVRRLDAALARLRHDAARRDPRRRRSAMPRTATRWRAASARRSPSWPTCSAGNGRVRPQSISPMASHPSLGGSSAIPHLPPPTAACLPKPATARGSTRSSAPTPPGIAALSPRRSTISAGTRRCSTPRGGAMAGS